MRVLRGRGFSEVAVRPINKGRHIILVVEKGGERFVKYVMWKSNFFTTFSKQFDLETGCFGESINFEFFTAIKRAKTDIEILVCYSWGIYSVQKEDWINYVKENDTRRITQSQGEVTVSVPVPLLQRWDEPMTSQILTSWVDDRTLPQTFRDKISMFLKKIRGRLTLHIN